jgi:hypothetical protein
VVVLRCDRDVVVYLDSAAGNRTLTPFGPVLAPGGGSERSSRSSLDPER